MTLVSENRSNKVMMFIDLRHVSESMKVVETSTPFKLDYYRLAVQLVGSRELVAAYVFDTRKPYGEDDSSARFHDKLRHDGFRVIARESFDNENKKQKEVDVAMACEMVVHALRDHYDVAIVVAGDRDFVPAVQHVQAAGKRVELAAFEKSASKVLIKVSDKYDDLHKMPLLAMKSPSDEESEDGEEAEAV